MESKKWRGVSRERGKRLQLGFECRGSPGATELMGNRSVLMALADGIGWDGGDVSCGTGKCQGILQRQLRGAAHGQTVLS